MVEIKKTIEIPEGINANIDGMKITLNYNGKSLTKEFKGGDIKIEKKENSLNIISKKEDRKHSKIIGTIVAHIKNMINGLKEEFVYKLEICNVHFPMTVRTEGKILKIKNFLGEMIERESKIEDNVNVEIKGNQIIITSPNREAAGQTAANIEQATKIKSRDRRVFQDGIFLTERAGKLI